VGLLTQIKNVWIRKPGLQGYEKGNNFRHARQMLISKYDFTKERPDPVRTSQGLAALSG